MPIGVIANCLGIIIGGIAGSFIGPRLTESFKTNLNLVFGACAMTMGISSISLMKNMPAVILSVILGTVIGLIIHLGNLTQKMGMRMEKIISKIIPGQSKKDAECISYCYRIILCKWYRNLRKYYGGNDWGPQYSFSKNRT